MAREGMVTDMLSSIHRMASVGIVFLAIVLVTTPVCPQVSRALQKQIDKALTKARPVLLEMASSASGGELALVCLALVHDGVSPDEPSFAKAMERLAAQKLSRTYDLSIRLMVMSELPDYPDRKKAAVRDLGLMIRAQNGGFTYQGLPHTVSGRRQLARRSWDLSNTQYAALGMRAARSLDVKIDNKHWSELAKAILDMQGSNGGFGYRPTSTSSKRNISRRSSSYSSMTVAGIAVLEICLQEFNRASKSRKRIKAAIGRAWKWMAEHAGEIGGSPPMRSSHNYYFHFGLERAAILSSKKKVGKVDWYEAGAKMMVKQQLPSGSWGQMPRTWKPRDNKKRKLEDRRDGKVARPRQIRTGRTLWDTSFAVLFLRRKFQKILSPITQRPGYMVRGLPAQATDKEIRYSVELEVARGYRAVPDLIKAMRSPILTRRRGAALAFWRITGRFRQYSPYKQPRESADIIKAAEAWWLKSGRKRVKDK